MAGWVARCLRDGDRALWLLLPPAAMADASGDASLPALAAVPVGPLRLLRLRDATVVTLRDGEPLAPYLASDGPSVLWAAP